MNPMAYNQFTLSVEDQQTAFARLLVVANETIRESGQVPGCVQQSIDNMLKLDCIRDQTVTERCDDMIKVFKSIDDTTTTIVYDTAYPHDWAVHWCGVTGEHVGGIVWLYRGDFVGPMAYSIKGLRLMAAIYHD